ncbi:serine hydrolase domain-containing protein (plasmid) [Coraliomargarita sp. W4R53]
MRLSVNQPDRLVQYAVVGVTVALLVGCSAQPPAATEDVSPSTAPATHASVCVSDPQAVIARTDAASTTPMPDDIASLIDEAAQSGFAAAAAPGAIVAVQSPDGLFTKAYGIADPASDEPMTTDMFHRVGSVTKTFTGTLIAQLAAEGEISLDDPISMYVDGVSNGDQVTIRMLADMTSAVTSYTTDSEWQEELFADPERVWTPDELLEAGLALPPQDFAPGEAFDYSNTNMILLGKVIELVTDEAFEEVLQERILTPLGLSGTSFPAGSPTFPEPHAQGFTLQGDTATPEKPTNATDWNPTWGWTAGELISTASDLLAFARAQATGDGLLPHDEQIERLTSFREFSGNGGYGLGWGCQSGWVGHGGELPGYNTSMFYDTGSDTTVITMTNSDILSGDCGDADTLLDNPEGLACSSPATRIFVSISDALAIPFTPAGAR